MSRPLTRPGPPGSLPFSRGRGIASKSSTRSIASIGNVGQVGAIGELPILGILMRSFGFAS